MLLWIMDKELADAEEKRNPMVSMGNMATSASESKNEPMVGAQI